MDINDVSNKIITIDATKVSIQTELQQLARRLIKLEERVSVLEREMLALRGFLKGTGSEHLADLQEGLKDI